MHGPGLATDAVICPRPEAERTDQRSKTLVWVAMLGGTAIAAFLVYGILARNPVPNPDPLVYGIAAKRLLAGQQLYVDFFESKPPLATLFYAIPGALWPRSYLAICLFLPPLLLLQASLWLWTLRPRIVTAAAGLLFIVFYPATFSDYGWTSTEHFANVFVTVALLLSFLIFRDRRLLWWRCVLAGGVICMAFHCRQNTLLYGLVPLLTVFLTPGTLRAKVSAILWLGMGAMAGWAIILGLVLLVSDLPSYFFQVFVFPQRFAESGSRGEVWHFVAGLRHHPLPVIAALAVGLAILGPHRRLVLIALPIAFLCCVAPVRAHDHYWAGLFPLVALSLFVGLPHDSPRTPHLERIAMMAIGAPLLFCPLHLVTSVLSPVTTRPMEEVAAWIDSHARPGDTLYVFGPLGAEFVQFRSALPPANKYTIGWELDQNNGMMADSFAEIQASYLAHPPTVLVIQDGKLQKIQEASQKPLDQSERSVRLGMALLQGHRYDSLHVLNGFHVYRLREEAPSAARTRQSEGEGAK